MGFVLCGSGSLPTASVIASIHSNPYCPLPSKEHIWKCILFNIQLQVSAMFEELIYICDGIILMLLHLMTRKYLSYNLIHAGGYLFKLIKFPMLNRAVLSRQPNLTLMDWILLEIKNDQTRQVAFSHCRHKWIRILVETGACAYTIHIHTKYLFLGNKSAAWSKIFSQSVYQKGFFPIVQLFLHFLF